MGRQRVTERLRRQFLKGRWFFPITLKSCLQTFIEDTILHEHLFPSQVLLASGFLTAQKTTLVLNDTSLSLLSCSAQNITERTTWVVFSLPLCHLSCILGMAALKGFLMPLLTVSHAAYSSVSFRCRFQNIARKNLPCISIYPKLLNPINSLACAFREKIKKKNQQQNQTPQTKKETQVAA